MSVAIAAAAPIVVAVGYEVTGLPPSRVAIRSTDDGGSWQPMVSGVGRAVAVSADGRSILTASGGVSRSVDGGASWQSVDVSSDAWLKTAIALARDGRTAFVVGDEGVLARSEDGGATWVDLQSPFKAGHFRDVALSDDARIALAIVNDTIIRSTDQGRTWQSGSGAGLRNAQTVALSPDGRIALAGGMGGALLRSADGGATWTRQPLGTSEDITDVAITDTGIALAVGGNATLLRSTDGGVTWAMPPHRSAPPPLAWLLWGLGLLALLPAFRPMAPDRRSPVAGDIAGIFATDRPLRAGDPDAAGVSVLAERISRFLRNRRTEPPLTLAITGPWGTGKSSVLNLLCADLERHGLRPVWFNAWHHQKEEHLFAALLEAVRQQAMPPLGSLAGIEVRFRLFRHRLRENLAYWLVALAVLALGAGLLAASDWPTPSEAWRSLRAALGAEGAAADWTQAAKGLAAPLGALAALVRFLSGFGDRLKSSGLDPGRLMAAAAGATGAKALGGQLAFRARFADALGEVADALGDRTITVVVDDLDRCRPEQVAEVMEAINFLTNAAGCFVILGIAREQVLLAMGLAHQDMAREMAPPDTPEREARTRYAENYLQKLIQIEVPVPTFDAAAAARLVASARAEPPARRKRAVTTVVWVAAALLAWGAIFAAGWRLHDLMQPPPPVIVAAPSKAGPPQPPLSGSPPAIGAPAAPTQAPASPSPSTAELPRTADPPVSARLLLALGTVLLLSAIGSVLWHALRRPSTAVDDAPDFAQALDAWAHAAFVANPSPRAMKRFLNRLRFVAAVPGSGGLDGPTLVGLAVMAHRDWALVEGLARGGTEVGSGLAPDLQSAVLGALRRGAASGLAPFAPTPAQARAFLDLWTGVTVRG